MAGREEMDYVYSLIDRIFRLSIGETGDFSGAMYDGDLACWITSGWCSRRPEPPTRARDRGGAERASSCESFL